MDDQYRTQLDSIEQKLNYLIQLFQIKGDNIVAALDDLTAQVAAQTTVEQSAVTLIQQLASEIQAASGDPAKIAALVSQLKTSASALAAAITANTPAPTTPPTPPPPTTIGS